MDALATRYLAEKQKIHNKKLGSRCVDPCGHILLFVESVSVHQSYQTNSCLVMLLPISSVGVFNFDVATIGKQIFLVNRRTLNFIKLLFPI